MVYPLKPAVPLVSKKVGSAEQVFSTVLCLSLFLSFGYMPASRHRIPSREMVCETMATRSGGWGALPVTPQKGQCIAGT